MSASAFSFDLSKNLSFGKELIALLVFFHRSARKTFDTSETQKQIGPVTIQFGKVQSKVSLKYDSWHKEVLSKFGNMLSNEMTEFHAHVSKSRSDLEQQSIDTANTSEAVGLITQVQGLKRKMKIWEKQVDVSLSIYICHALAKKKRGIMRSQNVFTYVSLPGLHRRTRAETCAYLSIFCVSRDGSTSGFSQLSDTMDFVDYIAQMSCLV